MKGFSGTNKFFHVLIPGGVYALFIILLAYAAGRQGISHYFAESAFRTGSASHAASAIDHLPDNPLAHETQGKLFLRNGEFTSAAEAFERAIALRPNDYLLWLRLGYSRSMLRDFGTAETAYARAQELAPFYSQPNFYMGTMLLEAGRSDEAFRYLGQAAERDHDLFPQVLRQARMRFQDDPLAIENSIRPTSREARKIVARYLIEHGYMTENVKSFLSGDELRDDEKNEFIRFLLDKKNFTVARAVWLSRSGSGSDTNEPLFDGGFEKITGTDESGLGWQIGQNITATAITRTAERTRSGSMALQIKFAGNVEVGRDIVSQLVFVEPGQKYTLTVQALSSKMVSAGLPAIIVRSVNNQVLGMSTEFRPSESKWTEYKVDFAAASEPVVLISLQRAGCNASPCPIFGELFLDDFQISGSKPPRNGTQQ